MAAVRHGGQRRHPMYPGDKVLSPLFFPRITLTYISYRSLLRLIGKVRGFFSLFPSPELVRAKRERKKGVENRWRSRRAAGEREMADHRKPSHGAR